MFWFCCCYPQLEIGCQALHHSFHVTPIRPKFVLAVLWLHHNSSSYKLYGLEKEHPAGPAQAPPRSWFPQGPLDVTKGKILHMHFWMDDCNFGHCRKVKLRCDCLPMHSSVGRHLHINTAGSFRKITFSRQDWTMVNMSYHKPSLKYPHSNSRQSGRRTNKRKRVRRHSCSLFGQLLVVFLFFFPQSLSVYLRWSGAVEKNENSYFLADTSVQF